MDVPALRSLLELLRDMGVVSYQSGALKIQLLPRPPARSEPTKPDKDKKAKDDEDMLFRSS